jgi:membrane protein HdeD
MPVGKLFAIGLPIALGVVMIGAGAVNFVGPKSVRDSFVRWGYPAGFHRVTGGLEAIAGLLLLIPAISRAGAIGSVVSPVGQTGRRLIIRRCSYVRLQSGRRSM